jgi:DDE superfamily endonuclease
MGMKTTRIPHAPSTPLPELAEFLAPFRVHLQRSKGPQTLERYLTGLLTEHPNKNCDTLAQIVPGTSEQRLQGLVTDIAWDDLNRQRVRRLLTLPTEGDGVLIFDDTGFAKISGRRSSWRRWWSTRTGDTGWSATTRRPRGFWAGTSIRVGCGGGFHRHALSVILAYSFLIWREWRQRQERARPGQLRRAFSPSAGPAPRVAAGGASAGLRLASAQSGQGVAVA